MLSQYVIDVRGFRIGITARSQSAANMVARDWAQRHDDATLAKYAAEFHGMMRRAEHARYVGRPQLRVIQGGKA